MKTNKKKRELTEKPPHAAELFVSFSVCVEAAELTTMRKSNKRKKKKKHYRRHLKTTRPLYGLEACCDVESRQITQKVKRDQQQ